MKSTATLFPHALSEIGARSISAHVDAFRSRHISDDRIQFVFRLKLPLAVKSFLPASLFLQFAHFSELTGTRLRYSRNFIVRDGANRRGVRRIAISNGDFFWKRVDGVPA